MNLHGFLARESIMYGSPEALDFTDMYFMTVAYHAYRASHELAVERGTRFVGFERSAYATGSISYINHSTSSIHPIASKIEIRKEGKIGRIYYPAPYMTNDNLQYFADAYEIGWKAIVDTYAEATRHVDQGLSLTLFFPDTATTRDLNKAQIYAWRKGVKTLYYIRIRQQALSGTEVQGCVSCML